MMPGKEHMAPKVIRAALKNDITAAQLLPDGNVLVGSNKGEIIILGPHSQSSRNNGGQWLIHRR